MEVQIDWPTKIIFVPKDELTLIQETPIEVRQMNLNEFRLALKDKEDDEEGIVFPDTHRHNTEVTVGGLTLARVIEIINGYTVTFEDGQYAVNLVGANSNVGDVVNVNQVSVRSQNSAGMTSSAAIEHASYSGAVNIDAQNITGNAKSGTIWPAGTEQQPVDNVADALLIDSYKGFNRLRIYGHADINSGQAWDVEDKVIFGVHPRVSSVSIDDSALTKNCIFRSLTINGTLDGNNQIEDCVVNDLTYVEGQLLRCELRGKITLGGTQGVTLWDCINGRMDTDLVAEVDMGGSGRNLAVHGFSGHLKISNLNGANTAVLSFKSGRAIIDSTVSAGMVILSGNCRVDDGHTGTAVVSTKYVLSAVEFEEQFAAIHGESSWAGSTADEVADAVLDETLSGHTSTGSLGKCISDTKDNVDILVARLTLARAVALDSIPSISSNSLLVKKVLTNRLELLEGNSNNWILYDDDKTTPLMRWNITGKDGESIQIAAAVPTKRTPA